MNPFDYFSLSLQGSKLIESSAGTGKTYAIASLYVRLLLESALQPREILVVTFTEAATQDLRKRIREKLQDALQAFEGKGCTDLFLGRLLERVSDRRRGVEVLNAARQSLDEAAIFTIHGFCQKVLQGSAFETASLFETELVTDQREILQEIVEDFWRIHFYPASAGFLRHALSQNFSPQRFIDFLGNSVSNPFLTIIPQSISSEGEKLAPLENRLVTCYDEARRVWIGSKEEIRELLSSHPGLHKLAFSQKALVLGISAMDRYFSSDDPRPLDAELAKFSSSGILKVVNKGFSLPAHGFFAACERLKQASGELTQAYERQATALKAELFCYARNELRQRKRHQNVRYFDDLLLDLYSTLQGPRSGEVARAIRDRYKAALIDEFQDTDPVQYAVFNLIYSHPDATLFLIGDPKQAIYSFRGADIFAYIGASKDVSERYTLNQNWRSTPELIAATNAIFVRRFCPFVFDEIAFHPAAAADKPEAGGLTWGGLSDPAPLKIWLMNRNDSKDTKPISKGAAEEAIAAAVAGEILRLLNAGKEGLVMVEGKPISPWDAAVLVRTNWQARLIQGALQRLRIPSVLYSDESVFGSREALETSRILEAIVDLSEVKVRAALVTDILGVSGDALALLNEDDAAWNERLKTFADYRQNWIEEGFMSMARILISREKVRQRLLSYPNGERRLTNLLHCLELLHQAALKHSLGLEGLVKWLAERRKDPRVLQSEEYQLRLETDAKAVKVLTIHKSKGLEYPVVFTPFCWHTARQDEEDVTFHDGANRTTIVRDIGSEQKTENMKLAEQESLAENIRLLYVALTRAKYRCYLVWGAFREAERSSLAYLLHTRSGGIEKLTDAQIRRDLKELVMASGRTISVSSLPKAEAGVYTPFGEPIESYACRPFRGELEQDWGTASFTSLISRGRREGDLPDRDKAAHTPVIALKSTTQPEDFIPSIFNFPRGNRAGQFFHEVFQHLDFTAAASTENQMLIQEKLAAYGFESFWEAPLRQMVGHVLSTPLETTDGRFFLSKLTREERLHEIEFTFPLDSLTPDRLKKVFAHHAIFDSLEEFPQKLARLDFNPVKGLMRGYIDLIFRWQSRFYLLDWKSNYLGGNIEAYAPDRLKDVMGREYYLLQCALYSVALHRYLRFRVPNYRYASHFGGVLYVFLRGVDSTRGAGFGVYQDCLPEGFIKELSYCLSSLED